MEMYEDAYCKEYGNNGYEDLKRDQLDLEANSTWESQISDMSILPMDNPIEAQMRFSDPTNTIPLEILLDTTENLGLMLTYSGKTSCMRDCAMSSLLSTLNLRGEGINRPDKVHQAIGLSAFLTGCREHSQVLTRAGKVAAIVSSRYEAMQISKLLKICDSLEDSFGEAEFIGGSLSHSLTTAMFQFPDAAAQVTQAYRNALVAAGRNLNTIITPVVEFRSSDTSCEAAKLLTYLKLGPGHLMPIGDGIAVTHTAQRDTNAAGQKMTCLEKFAQEADLLFSKLDYDIRELVPKMLAVNISYPANTFIGLCRYAMIPQKWGGQLEQDLRCDFPDGSDCTFLDIYEYLTQATACAVKDGLHPQSKRVLDLEEAISRIARNHYIWTKFDLPGTVAWNTVVQSRNARAA